MGARLEYALGEPTKWKSMVVMEFWKVVQCSLPLSGTSHLCTNSDRLEGQLEISQTVDSLIKLPWWVSTCALSFWFVANDWLQDSFSQGKFFVPGVE